LLYRSKLGQQRVISNKYLKSSQNDVIEEKQVRQMVAEELKARNGLVIASSFTEEISANVAEQKKYKEQG
jgi:hypothetical protein